MDALIHVIGNVLAWVSKAWVVSLDRKCAIFSYLDHFRYKNVWELLILANQTANSAGHLVLKLLDKALKKNFLQETRALHVWQVKVKMKKLKPLLISQWPHSSEMSLFLRSRVKFTDALLMTEVNRLNRCSFPVQLDVTIVDSLNRLNRLLSLCHYASQGWGTAVASVPRLLGC